MILAENKWKGTFAWLPEERYPDHQETYGTTFCEKEKYNYGVGLFRKCFNVNGKVNRMQLNISASVKYRVYLNEKFIGRGPAIQGGDYLNTDVLDYWFYDEYQDFESFLEKENCLGVEVCLQTGIQSDYSLGCGGLAFELTLWMSDGTKQVITSDDPMKCILDEGEVSPYFYDGTRGISEWKKKGYDDSGWYQAEKKFDKELIKKPIPHLQEEDVFAVNLTEACAAFRERMVVHKEECGYVGMELAAGCPLTFTLDFGKIHAGRIVLEAEGPEGTVITMHLGEIAGKIDSTLRLCLGSGKQSLETFNLQSLRYLTVTISNFKGTVRIDRLFIRDSYYPITQEGCFRCSDPQLNQIYEAGKYTLQMCRQDYHLDSPIHQEPLADPGDYLIESLMNYYAFGDRKLTALDIWRIAQMLKAHDGVMFHTSYSLLYVQMVWEYYLFSNDLDSVTEAVGAIEAVITRFRGYIGTRGIVENPPNYMFIDWVEVDNFNMHHPPKALGQASLTAMYYNALCLGAKLLRVCGKDTAADTWQLLAEDVKQAFHTNFWVPEAGLYCDGLNDDDYLPNNWVPANTEKQYFSQHTNSLAVLYGLAPEEYAEDIMEKVVSDAALIQAQPYFMHFVLEALYKCGLFEKFGLNQIRRYGKLLEECPTSLKEVWYGFDCDYSHAWGGTPTYQLPSKVLGIYPAEPGMTVISVNPMLGDLEWAEGRIPTPLGMIEVSVNRNGDRMDVQVRVPDGIQIATEVLR